MKKMKYIVGLMLLTAGSLPVSSQVSNDNEDRVNKIDARRSKNDFVPGQVLVKFKDECRVQVNRSRGHFASTNFNNITSVLKKFDVDEIEQLLPHEKPNRKLLRARTYNGDYIQERDLSQLYCVKLPEAHRDKVKELVDELGTLNEVEYAEPNYYCYIMGDSYIADNYGTNPMVTKQWYLDAYGVTELLSKRIINPERPVIAIIDTGVDVTHPDLKDNIVAGWDFINNTGDMIDDNMHGTHVAGIAAACNNEIGIVGANPKALIMPIKVLDSDGRGGVGTMLQGISYAVENGASVLNLSLGIYSYSKAASQVCQNASLKAVIVAAAGNDGKCLYSSHTGLLKHGIQPEPCFPAAFSFVLGVQATNRKGTLASFSNYDDDGPLFSCESSLDEPDGFNYELKAPGTEILSTLPNGNYGELQGTSMASPLVAGAISALMMVKKYDSQEQLWADLLHTNNIAEAYEQKELQADLDVVRIMLHERKEFSDETEDAYTGTNVVKAGETINIYPVIRCTSGEASNIRLKLEVDEYEDPNCVQIITGDTDFGWHLDAMGKAVSKNPLVIKIPDNIADSRHIRMRIIVSCENQEGSNSRSFTFVANNMETISGILSENTTLYTGHTYYVENDLLVDEGVMLTIEPGTRLEFAKGKSLASKGKLVAKGTPEKPIVLTSHHGEERWNGIYTRKITGTDLGDTIVYCRIESCEMTGLWKWTYNYSYPNMENCILTGGRFPNSGISSMDGKYSIAIKGVRNVVTECDDDSGGSHTDGKYWNIINNNGNTIHNDGPTPLYSRLIECNYFNNPAIFYDFERNSKYHGHEYWLKTSATEPEVDHADYPSYLGTSREDIVRPHIYELGNAPDGTWGTIDLSNMRKEPVHEAHGIVWKVLVNGKDAQDEYEELLPLGVGRHKFEVYFNRPMNKAVEPKISFGIRDPWTQNGVDEDGRWNADGTIYTVYKTITGKTASDGVNRIYVRGAEDDEFFPCPFEKSRFNIIVQAAGSMATGFAAEAGLGHVSLTWNNSQNDIEDAMGYNVYRYCNEIKKTIPGHYDDNWHWIPEVQVPDTIRVNQEILGIETNEYNDYDVIPNHTYYYFYKVLSTGLKEYDVSNIVAATPLTAMLGDANGSGGVDVIDVMTTVNYVLGMKPSPFVFDAADMNADKNIDVLDVIGIVQKVLHPNAVRSRMAPEESQAVYTIEDGVLYVESSIELGGVQIQVAFDKHQPVKAATSLDGFEQASAWMTDSDYILLAYSLNGKTLTSGKHALLRIGDGELTSMNISDANGLRVRAVGGNTTAIEKTIGNRILRNDGVYNLKGQKVAGSKADMNGLKRGVYIINGKKVVK